MYAIVFPIAIALAGRLSINPALIVGAVAGAGIAGEKNCAFTSEAVNVATAVGISPDSVKRIRIRYGAVFTAVAAGLYLIAGLIAAG